MHVSFVDGLKQNMIEEIGNEGGATAFISASFDNSVQKPIKWFIEMAKRGNRNAINLPAILSKF